MAGEQAEFDPTAVEFFEKSVRPLLVNNCYKCHSIQKQKGGLRLDSRAAVLKGGDSGPAAVPGEPAKSLLMEVLSYDPFSYQMPPDGKLKPEQIAVMTKWVKLGLPWPKSEQVQGVVAKAQEFDLQRRAAEHWCWQPLAEVEPPEVKDARWCRNKVDRFILARLEAAGLSPAPEADKLTLLRRVSFDLTGLPPTPQQIEEFLADQSPNAYDKLVQRLLANPHYGERWARHWLDLVRYADTLGHEFDFAIPLAYKYRDYVIRAFNDDVPYDQFVLEHIAGDLLTEPRWHPTERYNESVIATGFWHLGEGKHSPVDIREEEANRIDNQLDVLSKAFLGLSVGCARCHDHKFDAISTKDYYALAGYLQSSRYSEAFIDHPQLFKPHVNKLKELKQAERHIVVEHLQQEFGEGLQRLRSELRAARAVLTGEPVRQGQAPRRDILFDDFEQDSYQKWTAEGTAFGDRPNRLPLLDYQGDVQAHGRGLLNSHSHWKAGQRHVGDKFTGKLISEPFPVSRRYIRLLIGGGAHQGKTCVNLYVEGKLVGSLTGGNENRLQPAHFEVGRFAGKTAYLEVVDQVTDGWGNIGLDHIVFSDFLPGQRDVADYAQAYKVDAGRLSRWVKLLRQAAGLPQHPLHRLAELMVAADSAAVLKQWQGQLQATDRPEASGEILFADFSAEGGFGNRWADSDWFVSGWAFGEGPTPVGDVRATAPLRLSPGGLADSGRLSPQLQGILRSPTFEITTDRIHYRVAGGGGRIRLIIDGFQIIRNPIYGGLQVGVGHGQEFRWISQNVSMWKGHTAYVEFLDEGDGFLAVEKIVFSDRQSVSSNSKAADRSDPTQAGPFSRAELMRHSPGSSDALAALAARSFQQIAGRMAKAPNRRDVAIINVLVAARLAPANQMPDQLADLRRSQEAVAKHLPKPRRALALVDGTGEDERVFIRGNHRTLGPVVGRRFLEALNGADQPVPNQGSGRLALARRMVDDSNPLLPRVLVNRLWHHHFGRGIVPTVDDFGRMGQKPSHPLLLDWLARNFRNEGWSIKQLHRLILTSSTYRMASRPRPAGQRLDPTNELLHHWPVKRLEGEAIRDAMLAVAGRLNDKMYGPGVLPHLTPFMEGRGRPRSGPLDAEGRRSLYISVRRNFLTPMLLVFDYPTPFTAIGSRGTTNVPAQALTLLNDPFVIQQADRWGQRIAKEQGTATDHIQRMYLKALGRAATKQEVTSTLAYLREITNTAEGEAIPTEGWQELAHVLMNMKEFIFLH